jgi:hypothetical protein
MRKQINEVNTISNRNRLVDAFKVTKDPFNMFRMLVVNPVQLSKCSVCNYGPKQSRIDAFAFDGLCPKPANVGPCLLSL